MTRADEMETYFAQNGPTDISPAASLSSSAALIVFTKDWLVAAASGSGTFSHSRRPPQRKSNQPRKISNFFLACSQPATQF